MPPKMHTCVLCKEQVSRRKSLSLEILGQLLITIILP